MAELAVALQSIEPGIFCEADKPLGYFDGRRFLLLSASMTVST